MTCSWLLSVVPVLACCCIDVVPVFVAHMFACFVRVLLLFMLLLVAVHVVA